MYKPHFNLREINFLLKLIHDSKSYESKTGSKIQLKLYWCEQK